MNIFLKTVPENLFNSDNQYNLIWKDLSKCPYIQIKDGQNVYNIQISNNKLQEYIKKFPELKQFEDTLKTIYRYKNIKSHSLFNDQVLDGNSFDFVDKIYCIHYLPYKDRIENIKRQLEYYNIQKQKNFDFYYTTPNKYYDYLFYDKDSHIDVPLVNLTNINYTVNSYNLIKSAYQFGYQSLMIIEDDICFIKDKDLFTEYMINIPKDYDLILFEYFISPIKNKNIKESYEYIINSNNIINDLYIEFNDESIYDTGFFMISRKMMKHMIDNIEKRVLPFDGYTRNQNCDDDFGIKRYISKIPLAIQKEYIIKQDSSNKINKYPFIDINDYVS